VLNKISALFARHRFGRPNVFPLAFAALRPDTVRSRIISRSNSATRARICSKSRLVGFAWSVSRRGVSRLQRRFLLLRLYYQTVKEHARLVAQIREVAGSREHVLFEQLMKRPGELRLKVKRAETNCSSTARDTDASNGVRAVNEHFKHDRAWPNTCGRERNRRNIDSASNVTNTLAK